MAYSILLIRLFPFYFLLLLLHRLLLKSLFDQGFFFFLAARCFLLFGSVRQFSGETTLEPVLAGRLDDVGHDGTPFVAYVLCGRLKPSATWVEVMGHSFLDPGSESGVTNKEVVNFILDCPVRPGNDEEGPGNDTRADKPGNDE